MLAFNRFLSPFRVHLLKSPCSRPLPSAVTAYLTVRTPSTQFSPPATRSGKLGHNLDIPNPPSGLATPTTWTCRPSVTCPPQAGLLLSHPKPIVIDFKTFFFLSSIIFLPSSGLPQGWAPLLTRDYRGQLTEHIRWQQGADPAEKQNFYLTSIWLHLSRNLSSSLSPLRSRYSSEEVRKQEILTARREVESGQYWPSSWK